MNGMGKLGGEDEETCPACGHPDSDVLPTESDGPGHGPEPSDHLVCPSCGLVRPKRRRPRQKRSGDSWVRFTPIALLGFLSGQFTAVYARNYHHPELDPEMTLALGILTGLAAIGLCIIAARTNGGNY